MALTAKMLLRQGQSLVMTPQLLQAIKLLQYSSVELAAFVEEELERNPLLERAEDGPDPTPTGIDAPAELAAGESAGEFSSDPGEGDWASSEFSTTAEGLSESLGTEAENAFDGDRDLSPAIENNKLEAMGLSDSAWSGVGGGNSTGEASNIEAYVAVQSTLPEFLNEQLALATNDPVERMIGQAVIDAIDEAGYLRESAEEIADRLGASLERVEKVIALVQTFEPTGVGARDLAECLALQLREQDRFDPAMQAMIANLPLVARRDFAALRKVCGVDDDDLKDMMGEIRCLDPKPGRAFGAADQPVAPDVVVRAARDGSWQIELNSDALPRVLINQTYVATVSRKGGAEEERNYLSQCLQTANWLTKSLEQRARTILKVSTEIVRRQDAFLAHGVEHLRPLNLKNIADAVGLHKSTVSRVTSNKYMATPRGLFELKYFFTASIAAHGGGDAHSAEAVRFKIKQMIDAEAADAILSDDAIVEKLKGQNIDIARRTVAKYRESLRIPSSVERRREKQAPSAF